MLAFVCNLVQGSFTAKAGLALREVGGVLCYTLSPGEGVHYNGSLYTLLSKATVDVPLIIQSNIH